MIFLDTETCGLHGVAVLLQYAIDDGEPILWELWRNKISDTLMILESIANDEVVGFNLAFDWFHLQKIYSLFSLALERLGDVEPIDHIDEIAALEREARTFDTCLKPKAAQDLMLHSRKGPYQSLMARRAIRIRKVPNLLAYKLAALLEETIPIDDIYFSRRKDQSLPRWQVLDNDDDNENFKDVNLSFAPSGALKVLAQHVLGVEEATKFKDVELDIKFRPSEVGWAPFALSTKERGWRRKVLKEGKERWLLTWPGVLMHHINHWAFYKPAREYARLDVVYTRDLWRAFGEPPTGDDDSELACMVGAVRWRGFKINVEKLTELRNNDLKALTGAPLDPKVVKRYIGEVMSETERSTFTSTAKKALEAIAKWEDHPAAERAQEVIDARKAKKRIEVYDKLIIAGRFHASFRVIGTLSSRMSGADGLNPQGIDRNKTTRGCFDLADDGFQLDGGDFESFEVCIAEAAYDDPELRRALTEEVECFICHGECEVDDFDIEITKEVCKQCKGIGMDGNKMCTKCTAGYADVEIKTPKGRVKCPECNGKGKAKYKIHGLFGMELSGLSYAEVAASAGGDPDWYGMGKAGIFGMMYGGDWGTLVRNHGVEEDIARSAEEGFLERFKKVGESREAIFDAFCSMKQQGDVGSKINWADPAEHIESLLGFRRYFTLENQICKALFNLANNPPGPWKQIKMKCIRREREQTLCGATMSAIFAACFGIQSSNMRAAANHVIQSTGAQVTKRVQRRIWDLQPYGVNSWLVVPMNVHDEIACPCRPELSDKVYEVVRETVESYRSTIPLIEIDWARNASSWATMK